MLLITALESPAPARSMLDFAPRFESSLHIFFKPGVELAMSSAVWPSNSRFRLAPDAASFRIISLFFCFIAKINGVPSSFLMFISAPLSIRKSK